VHFQKSPQLLADIAEFRLAFTCEDCRHFRAADDSCDLLYPTGPHRRATFDTAKEGDAVLFCKVFEAAETGQ
jgi:hypothetical protein